MENHLTLKELNSLVKETIEVSFPDELWLVAEIGELKENRTGHCYLELVEKDQINETIIARSRATIWAWQYRFIKPYFETNTGQSLAAGLKVLLLVSIEFHEVYGISLNIKDIDPNYTLGDKARKRQEVINRLIDEGIFEMNKEIPLTEIPTRIAIISSPTAAGYDDFVNQLHHNSFGYRFYTKLFPSSMQGNDAVNSIIAALDRIYELENHFDVVVIIRGGGSQMDLSCFDAYDLALHITQFPLPVLTGIGHDKDESVADMVAHTRLKTPTAVADFLIDRVNEVAEEISELEEMLNILARNKIDEEKQRLNQAFRLFKPLIKAKLDRSEMMLHQTTKAIKPLVNEIIERQQFKMVHFSDHLLLQSRSLLKDENNKLQKLASSTSFVGKMNINKESHVLIEKTMQLKNSIQRKFEIENATLEWFEKNRQFVDPLNILKRGYSITLKNGKAVKSADEIKKGDKLETLLKHGTIKSEVLD